MPRTTVEPAGAARRTGSARDLTRTTVQVLASLAALASVVAAAGQPRHFSLESTAGLRLHNVAAEPAELKGRRGIRVTISEAARRQVESQAGGGPIEQLAVIDGLEFGNGVIQAEIAGAPMPNAPAGARGFVGLAFRLQSDIRSYDAFYLRPTNGRADDQVRRNHSAQYISHPDWTWFRFRKEAPEKYESYVDLVPDEWTKVKIEVRGAQARLYVHDQSQPTLIVNDVKSGAAARGAVALWLDAGTVAHFRNLTVTPE
jgi:hypothetical protein